MGSSNTQQVIYTEIERLVVDLQRLTNPLDAAASLRDLALAYRLTAGGPQPGGSVVNR